MAAAQIQADKSNDPAFLAKLTEWQAIPGQIAALQAQEKRLREELFGMAFETPKEGTNNATLPDGWKFKGVLRINRSIDKAALPSVMQTLRGMGFNPDPLIEYDPKLVDKEYKALPENIRQVFDTALTIKPGLPSVELVAPKVKA